MGRLTQSYINLPELRDPARCPVVGNSPSSSKAQDRLLPCPGHAGITQWGCPYCLPTSSIALGKKWLNRWSCRMKRTSKCFHRDLNHSTRALPRSAPCASSCCQANRMFYVSSTRGLEWAPLHTEPSKQRAPWAVLHHQSLWQLEQNLIRTEAGVSVFTVVQPLQLLFMKAALCARWEHFVSSTCVA